MLFRAGFIRSRSHRSLTPCGRRAERKQRIEERWRLRRSSDNSADQSCSLSTWLLARVASSTIAITTSWIDWLSDGRTACCHRDNERQPCANSQRTNWGVWQTIHYYASAKSLIPLYFCVVVYTVDQKTRPTCLTVHIFTIPEQICTVFGILQRRLFRTYMLILYRSYLKHKS